MTEFQITFSVEPSTEAQAPIFLQAFKAPLGALPEIERILSVALSRLQGEQRIASIALYAVGRTAEGRRLDKAREALQAVRAACADREAFVMHGPSMIARVAELARKGLQVSQ